MTTTRPIGSTNGAWVLSPLSLGDWREQAACRTADPRLFDGSVDGETQEQRSERHERAKAVCARCDMTDKCLDEFERGIDEGIRGGRELPPLVPRKRVLAEIRHGSAGGGQAHRRRGEAVCRLCMDAENRAKQDAEAKRKRDAETRPPKPPTTPECGTNAAYKRHYKAGEKPCDPCREAHNAKARDVRNKAKAA